MLPGAKLVFTHGFTVNPNSTAFLATSPAAIITLGLDVFVQLVIAAITISPDSNCFASRGPFNLFETIVLNDSGTS